MQAKFIRHSILIFGVIISISAVLVASPRAYAAETIGATDYKLTPIITGLDMPWGLAFLPNGDMLVTELSGTLRRISNGRLVATPIAGVPEVYYAGQGGLMDIALHPDYSNNQLVYLSLSVGTDDANTLRVVRGRFTGTALENVETIFESAPKRDTPAHYGGRMAFMADNSLLITGGDGFDYREEAQNLGNHLGSIVRIADDGKVPSDNPFATDETAQPEIWSYGHRNGQSIIYDATTRAVFQTEHGARGGDELNRVMAGKNYGWPVITHGVDYNFARISPYTEYEGMEQPLLHWTPSIAPSGMTLYRGKAFRNWQGDIFVTSLVFNLVRRIDMDGVQAGVQEDLFAEIGERLRDIRTAPDGLLYILSEGSAASPGGKIWRVSPK